MTFLPEDYKIPNPGSNYMKLEQGENIFRVLSDAIIGYEWWTSETIDGKEVRKPNRVAEEDAIPVGEIDDEQLPKHFWAFIVWNYQEKKVQILELTQRTIQKTIMALQKSKGWGDPKNYDISITKTGDKMETRYSVMPIPPKPLDEDIKKKYSATKIDLNALYRGDDPFQSEKKEDINPDEIPF